ncbi:MAG TPA: Gfo/Idh/MocA family oxidoreductase, partial [Thermoplasmata archaeon]|nr:Gfo/Idh/MocA family oxidoreductase [Thermoplasmata archaeon]
MRVGVVGLGSMGQNHVRILSEMGVLASVADIVPDIAKAVAAKYSVESHLSYQDLLRSDIDAVVIVTPTDTHEKIASDAIRAGKHVLLEKPMTGSSEKLRLLAALAGDKKVVLA